MPGAGNPEAKILMIGEAPGWKEDQYGKPFIGPAGEILDSGLELIGLKRSDVFIINVVNCRPPNNRDPRDTELEACRHWLDSQMIEIPYEIVVAMGRYASLALCPDVKPVDLRGSVHNHSGVLEYFMLHPAATLHNPHMKPGLDEQFRQLGELIA